jgi:hypothetical protein
VSDTEARVRQLLEVAVGMPPNSISVSKVRRLARRRRTVHGIAAASTAAATCAAVSVLAVGLTGPLSGHAPASSPRAHGVPRYYIQETGLVSPRYTDIIAYQRALVRNTASGAVRATVRCPLKGAAIAGIAPADHEAFFLSCVRTSGSVVLTRLYRFRLTSAGRVRGYTPVPGGVLVNTEPSELTAAANGSEIAMITSLTSTTKFPEPDGVLVINTRTGAQAMWRGKSQATSAQDLTLSPDGRDLRFLLVDGVDVKTEASERQVSPASRGGVLGSARVLVRWHPADALITAFSYAQVSPGGSVLTVAVPQLQRVKRVPEKTKITWVVEQISVPGGRVIRVLFRASLTLDLVVYLNATSDPQGLIILHYGTGVTKPGYRNGWLDHGHLVPLAPAHAIPAQDDQKGFSIGPETW